MAISRNKLLLFSGLKDSSDMTFTYTDTRRQYDAGVMVIGHFNSQRMIIPPHTHDFRTSGLCPSECTQSVRMDTIIVQLYYCIIQFLPPGGVKIFANMFHTHEAGR